MIAETSSRVSSHTDPAINNEIRAQTQRNIAFFENHPECIDERLEELNKEWDVERMLETGSSTLTLTLTGLLLGFTRSRRWLLLSFAVQGFFMQHALQGWCPPLPILRRLGFRTQYEIEQERYSLKALRGDFRHVREGSGSQRSSEILGAVSR